MRIAIALAVSLLAASMARADPGVQKQSAQVAPADAVAALSAKTTADQAARMRIMERALRLNMFRRDSSRDREMRRSGATKKPGCGEVKQRLLDPGEPIRSTVTLPVTVRCKP